MLVPAHRDRVIDHERFVGASASKVAIRQSVHQPVRQRIELVARVRLGNAGAPARAGGRERRHGDGGGAGERRVRRGREVHVELPQVERVRAKVQIEVRLAGRRRSRPIQVGRQQTGHAGALLEADLRGGSACEHFAPVERAGARADEGVAVEHVEGEVVAVRPDAQLGIVVEVGLGEGVAVVRPRCVRACRDSHTLEEGRGADRELRQHPATCRLVVLGDDVAVVVALAAAAEPCPWRVAGGRSGQEIAALVVDGEGGVDPLHELRGADRTVGIRRRAVARIARSVTGIADTITVDQPSGRDVWRGRRSLDDGIGLDVRPLRHRDRAQGHVAPHARRLPVMDHVTQGRRDIMVDRLLHVRFAYTALWRHCAWCGAYRASKQRGQGHQRGQSDRDGA